MYFTYQLSYDFSDSMFKVGIGVESSASLVTHCSNVNLISNVFHNQTVIPNNQSAIAINQCETAMWDAEDLYSHGILRLSHNIIPYVNGTGTGTVMILLCFRDSLREYKSSYVIIMANKISLYNGLIISESTIFNLLFCIAFNQLLSPLYESLNLCSSLINLCSYDMSLKNTNVLSNGAMLLGYQSCIGNCMSILLISNIFMNIQGIELIDVSI
jgi:hypothetical protein